MLNDVCIPYGGICQIAASGEADPPSGSHAAHSGQQRLRAGDPAVRGGAQELAVLLQSTRRGCECDPEQPDRDCQGDGREPCWCLRELFEKLPHARTQADYLALLPSPPPS